MILNPTIKNLAIFSLDPTTTAGRVGLYQVYMLARNAPVYKTTGSFGGNVMALPDNFDEPDAWVRTVYKTTGSFDGNYETSYIMALPDDFVEPYAWGRAVSLLRDILANAGESSFLLIDQDREAILASTDWLHKDVRHGKIVLIDHAKAQEVDHTIVEGRYYTTELALGQTGASLKDTPAAEPLTWASLA